MLVVLSSIFYLTMVTLSILVCIICCCKKRRRPDDNDLCDPLDCSVRGSPFDNVDQEPNLHIELPEIALAMQSYRRERTRGNVWDEVAPRPFSFATLNASELGQVRMLRHNGIPEESQSDLAIEQETGVL